MNMQNTNSAFRMTWVTLTALSAAMLVGVSHAASPGDVPSQTVAYQDLDLNSDAGVQALYRRIQFAADQVCGEADTRELARLHVKKACVDRAVSDAIATVIHK
ncbi:MAG: UrcA family protein [Proteobacteria bacterium]|nr:UrcA family protein [Pseudomonadota bacterium]